MANKKVMIVDDDQEFLSEFNEMLERSGYDMIAVGDPMQALDAAVEAQPDVILLDLKMPGKNGLYLAYEIQRRFHPKVIPIIVISAHFKDGYDMVMNVCGIRQCLRKPFNPLDAITYIEQAIWESENAKEVENSVR
jgi:two-component system, OmpR family, alkaline phosphatase synthesis response regulator PhoP